MYYSAEFVGNHYGSNGKATQQSNSSSQVAPCLGLSLVLDYYLHEARDPFCPGSYYPPSMLPST